MASKRSDACPYKSRFSAGEDIWVTPHQYLAELMVARQARKSGGEPPPLFWNLDRWKREFAVQARHAAGLLKIYSFEAIARALRSEQGRRIYSLKAPWLDPLIKDEQERLDRQAKRREAEPPPTPLPATPAEPEVPRPAFVQKKSTLSKLDDL